MGKSLPFFGAVATLILIAASVASVSAYTISGETVFVDTTKVYYSQTPHTRVGSGWAEYNFTSKQFDGLARLGVLADGSTPTKLQFWNPHNVDFQMSYTCPWDFNYTLVPTKHFWCYFSENNTVMYEHDFETGNIGEKTAYWTETRVEPWSNTQLQFEKANVDFDGFTKAYYVDADIMQGKNYKFRIWWSIPVTLEKTKHGVFGYPSSYNNNYLAADADGKFLYLDPWTAGSTGVISAYKFDNNKEDSHDGRNLTGTPTYNTTAMDGGYCIDSSDAVRVSVANQTTNMSNVYTIAFWAFSDQVINSSYGGGTEKEDSGVLMSGRPATSYRYTPILGGWFGGAAGEVFSISYLSNSHVWWWGGFRVKKGWSHYVMTCVGNNKFKFYLNGTSMGNSTLFNSSPMRCPISSIAYEVGGISVGGGYGANWKGTIDELTFWNRTLNSSEVVDLYNSHVGIYYPFTTAYYIGDLYIRINDSFDGAYLSGINVTLANGRKGTTGANGYVNFTNESAQAYTIIDPAGTYYSHANTSPIRQNVTKHDSVVGGYLYVDEISDPFGNAISHLNILKLTCGVTTKIGTNLNETNRTILKPNDNCQLNWTTDGWYGVSENDTVGHGAYQFNFTTSTNTGLNFTGDTTGTTYYPICYNSIYGVLAHTYAPYYAIPSSSTNLSYACFGTSTYAADSFVVNITRPFPSLTGLYDIVLTEYTITLLLDTNTSVNVYWPNGTRYNWTSTSFIQTTSIYDTGKVTFEIDITSARPQFYEFKTTEIGTLGNETLHIIQNKDSFFSVAVITSNGNPLNDVPVEMYVMNETAGGVETWLFASRRFTDDQGGVTFNYKETTSSVKLVIAPSDYPEKEFIYEGREVVNTTVTSPIYAIFTLSDTEDGSFLTTTFSCYTNELWTRDGMRCYLSNPFVATRSVLVRSSTYGYQRTIPLTSYVNATYFELVRCNNDYQRNNSICDYENNTNFTFSVTAGDITYVYEFYGHVLSPGESYFRNNVSAFTFFQMPEGAGSGGIRVIWFIIAVVLGAFASTTFVTEQKNAGFHTFNIIIIVAAAVTQTFLWAVAVITIHYVLRMLQFSWEA